MGKRTDVSDAEIGRRVRVRRTLIGMSQERLGAVLGLSFQQVQKYEAGANRITAGRLYELAQALGVNVSHFFGAEAELLEGAGRLDPADAERMSRRETLELVRAWARIADPAVRDKIGELVAAVARGGPPPRGAARGKAG